MQAKTSTMRKIKLSFLILALPFFSAAQKSAAWKKNYTLRDSCGNYFIVLSKDKIGLTDSTGKEVIACGTYDNIELQTYQALSWTTGQISVNNSCLFKVLQGKKSGIVNETGKAIVPLDTYDELYVDFGMGGSYPIPYANKNGKFAFFTPDGKQLTDFKYSSADTGDFGEFEFKEGKKLVLAYVRIARKGKVVLLDKDGKEHAVPK